MSNGNSRPHMRMFLYGVCQLLKEGKNESCTIVEEKFITGIASYLYNKYNDVFYEICHTDNLEPIDDYYKELYGIADGVEEKRYCCEENDGLWLVLKIALNEMP